MTFMLFLSRTSPKYHHALGVNYFVIKIFPNLQRYFTTLKGTGFHHTFPHQLLCFVQFVLIQKENSFLG